MGDTTTYSTNFSENNQVKEKKSFKGTIKWKEVLVGGVSGIALVAAGSLFTSSATMDDSSTETTNTTDNSGAENTNQEAEIAEATTQMATSVNDSMSFSDAFNAARSEVGAGGVFEWHGNLYNTYTTDEWHNMDDTAKGEFAESIHWDGPSHEYVASNHGNSSHSDDTEDVHQTINTSTGTSQDQSTGNAEDDTADVEIIGVDHVNVDGEDVVIGSASIGGQNVYFIDVGDEDDEFELMAVDDNKNQIIEEDEIVDISEEHVSVSRFEQLAQTNSSSHSNENDPPVEYYADNEDLPDYVNDADPGTLA